MQQRELGRTGIFLSPFCFGSMRLDPKKLSEREALDLLGALVEGGVTSFHSSHEYDAHPFFCRVLRLLREQHPALAVQHIVKIAVPHFNETRFSDERFREVVHAQLKALHTQRIDVVQWLVRHTPNSDEPRLRILDESLSEFAECWSELHAEGKVGALTSFPYSDAFARRVLRVPFCDGLTTYLNPAETECAPLLDQMEAAGQGFVAIRPLLGGQLTSSKASDHDVQIGRLQKFFTRLGIAPENITGFCLSFPLLHPAVASVILSVSNRPHTTQALSTIAAVISNRERFHAMMRELPRYEEISRAKGIMGNDYFPC